MHVKLLGQLRWRLLTLDGCQCHFALNAGVWFRRLRFVMLSPDPRRSSPPSGRKSTYPTLQIPRATSLRRAAAAYAWSHTAAPMLSGTLVTIAGFLPVGFARSTAGEYAGNIFWVVGFALIVSWIVAVVFTPFLGVKMLPAIEPIEGGHRAIYDIGNTRPPP
jgi:hypothetical protein